MSHRSHQSDYGLVSTPNTSVPGTPGSGSQDYALEEVCIDLLLKSINIA